MLSEVHFIVKLMDGVVAFTANEYSLLQLLLGVVLTKVLPTVDFTRN